MVEPPFEMEVLCEVETPCESDRGTSDRVCTINPDVLAAAAPFSEASVFTRISVENETEPDPRQIGLRQPRLRLAPIQSISSQAISSQVISSQASSAHSSVGHSTSDAPVSIAPPASSTTPAALKNATDRALGHLDVSTQLILDKIIGLTEDKPQCFAQVADDLDQSEAAVREFYECGLRKLYRGV